MEAKSGIKLPTIEAKISNMGRAPIKEFNDDNSDGNIYTFSSKFINVYFNFCIHIY